MPDDTAPAAQSTANPLRQITRGQWLIAAAVLIAVPIVAYLGTFYLYPYVQDLIEGESPIDTILAEYGVEPDAETQLLTIRRGDLVNSVSINGTLEYANRERISFATTGTIDNIEIEVGDFVSQGDILMSLDDDAIIDANESLQNASVALRDAQDKLEVLINPDDKAINDATLKILNAQHTLSDAEDALADMLETPEAQVVAAELDLAKAISQVDAAEENLYKLLEPTDVEIANAELAIAEAEKTLSDLIEEHDDLIAEDTAAIRTAELAVAEAGKAHAEALETYEQMLSIDQDAVNQAELDLEKANLALAQSEQAILDAEIELHDAIENTDTDVAAKKLEIAQAQAAIAKAKLDLSNAIETYEESQKPFDQDEVADLRKQITKAENDIQIAEGQLSRFEIETGAEVRKLDFDLQEAQDEYQNLFFKWLGMDISKYQWTSSPDEIFDEIGKSLAEIMETSTDTKFVAQQSSASSVWTLDDPQTPWNEYVVQTWTTFFLSELRFDCAQGDIDINYECVNVEFDNAWDQLLTKTETYQTAELAHSQQHDNTQDAIDNAHSLLEDLQQKLEEALTPATEDEINDAFAKQEVTNHALIDAQNKLQTLLVELDRLEPELEARRTEARLSLDIAKKALEVAINDVKNAQDKLADIQAGADDSDLSVAYAKTRKAESDLNEAIEHLETLHEVETQKIALLDHQIQLAHAELDEKIETLENLIEDDEIAIQVARAELAAAEENLADKITILDDLSSPDPDDVELKRQEIEVAIANLNAAEQDLDALLNPDQATVALRRAEVETAREQLTTAFAATEGAHIIAPFDGVIADINVQEGQIANPGSPAVIIADPSIVEISGTVDEVDVLFLQVDDPASIELEALGDEPLIGNISDIAAFGESNQGVVTYPVTIQTEQPDTTQLPEGLSAVAEVVIREQTDQLLVPIQALFGSVNQPILLISKSDGTLEPRNVALGISDDFWTVIESGVSQGETILMTVVGADTSQFGQFGAIRAVSGPPRGGR